MRRPGIASLARTLFVAAVTAAITNCATERGPADIALDYGRALYASDAAAIYRLASAEDRRAKDEKTFRQQGEEPRGFARDLVRQLASYIVATPVATMVDSRRATVKLRLRLPDANASAVRTFVLDWDEARLDALSTTDRAQIVERLAQLHRDHTLPTVEGDETLDLVKEPGGWRIVLNWAGGVHVRFAATVAPGTPLDVTLLPPNVVLKPGERVRVTLHAKNRTAQRITARVGHRIEPVAQANFLALVQCPLFVPVTLAPGETRDYDSVYLVLREVPPDVKDLGVTYEFAGEH